MKEGLIVYLVGSQEIPDASDLDTTCRELGVCSERVELLSLRQGFCEVEDGLHFLRTQGCGRVSLLVAQWSQHRLHPMYPPVRLCG